MQVNRLQVHSLLFFWAPKGFLLKWGQPGRPEVGEEGRKLGQNLRCPSDIVV